MLEWMLRYFRRTKNEVSRPRPRLARVQIAKARCPVCSEPLEDGDLVLENGPTIGHVECLAIIRRSRMPEDPEPHPDSVYVTQQEWDAWMEQFKQTG